MVATSSKLKDPPADMDVPAQIDIRSSHVDSERMGLWCKKTIKKGSRFGPFIGDKALEVDDRMDPSFIWEIVDVETKEFLFYINATDPRRGNWMRYINCARYFEEQNIVSEQDGIDIFFEAIKDIEPGRELLTWYEKSPIRRKKGKKRTINHVRRAKKTVSRVITEVSGNSSNTASSVSQRGRRRSAKKYWTIEENADPRDAALASGELGEHEPNGASEAASAAKNSSADIGDNGSLKLSLDGFFEFELLPVHTAMSRLGRKMFECDVCSGVYRHGFSLKRHYLRNHINRKYISKVDALNCNIAIDEDLSKLSRAGIEADGEPNGAESGLSDEDCRLQKDKMVESKSSDMTTLQMDVDEIIDDEDSSKTILRERTSSTPSRTQLPELYRCYVCERFFDQVSALKDHFCESRHTASTADKRFACRHCQMQFKHRQNLVRHEVVHSGAKPYECDQCNKRFPTLTNRRRHERIHRGTRLSCPLCSSSFTQTNDLKKHVRRQHPESYRACAYCSRYFTADSQLSVHLRRVHPGSDLDANRRQAIAQRDAKHSALEADRAESQRLASAQGVQTDGKPTSTGGQFACTVCHKSFLDYANMCRHRRLAHGCGISGVSPDDSDFDDQDDVKLINGGSKRAAPEYTSAAAAMDVQQSYFAGVSKNIAINLNHHVEGKSEHLARASSHIRWRHGTAATATAAATAGLTNGVVEGAASSVVQLEEFNFPRGFEIRPLSELYECKVEPRSKTTSVSELSSSQIPDVQVCETRNSVLNSTAVVHDEHVLENHGRTNSEIDPVADVDASVLVLELPMDLRSSPTAAASVDVEDKDKVSVVTKTERCENVQVGSPNRVDDKSLSAVESAKKLVCLVCLGEFVEVVSLLQHQTDRHPNIDCRHIEVDANYLSSTSRRQPTVVGLLNVSSSQLPASLNYCSSDVASEADDVTCTKCRRNFQSRSALHSHVVECGDYWRNLSDRLTWVFVLRGSQIPAPPPALSTSTSSSARTKQQHKHRGKCQWAAPQASDDALCRRLQRMLIRQHVGIPVTGDELTASPSGKMGTGVGGHSSTSRRASARVSSRRSSDSPPPRSHTEGAVRSGGVSAGRRTAVGGQNTRRHCHRRAAMQPSDVTTETPEVPRCDLCSTTFQTAEELGSHRSAGGCGGSKTVGDAAGQTDAADDPEEDVFDPTKHLCIYCSRQFTFVRALRRHVLETCTVRRELVEQNEYIDEEWETELSATVGFGASGSKLNSGSAEAGNDDPSATESGKTGRRRRRCMNWTSSKSRSRRSARSSDDADDSLFGWEDAFLSTWGKDERDDITMKRGDSVGVKTSIDAGRHEESAEGDVKLKTESLSDTETQTKVDSSGTPLKDVGHGQPPITSTSTPPSSSPAKELLMALDKDAENSKSDDGLTPAKNKSEISASSDLNSSAAKRFTSAATEDDQADDGGNDEDEDQENGQKKPRKRRGHRLTAVKRKKK